jgi:type II secretory pathway pseudopilin PulG
MKKLKRPIVFGLEVAAGLVLAAAGAWVANRFSNKANRQAQAEERTAAAAERIADVMSRPALPRPSMIHQASNILIIKPDPEPCPDDKNSCDGMVAR